jgi:hypothetical protein
MGSILRIATSFLLMATIVGCEEFSSSHLDPSALHPKIRPCLDEIDAILPEAGSTLEFNRSRFNRNTVTYGGPVWVEVDSLRSQVKLTLDSLGWQDGYYFVHYRGEEMGYWKRFSVSAFEDTTLQLPWLPFRVLWGASLQYTGEGPNTFNTWMEKYGEADSLGFPILGPTRLFPRSPCLSHYQPLDPSALEAVFRPTSPDGAELSRMGRHEIDPVCGAYASEYSGSFRQVHNTGPAIKDNDYYQVTTSHYLSRTGLLHLRSQREGHLVSDTSKGVFSDGAGRDRCFKEFDQLGPVFYGSR